MDEREQNIVHKASGHIFRREENTTAVRELRVVFLGDSGSGKSHILARLLNDGKRGHSVREVSAPGIAIVDKTYRIDDRNVLVHFWDFGAQEITHELHRMFLTDRTLYVVVLNVREGNQEERARYWLDNLSTFADGAPVLLVLNKRDQNPNAGINPKMLRAFYPGLREVVRISALNDGVDSFELNFVDELVRQIRDFPGLFSPIPRSWTLLKAKVQKLHKDCISGEMFHRLCDECGIKGGDNDRQKPLRWFSELGICFYCSDGPALRDYLVFKPEWIINAIYAMRCNMAEQVCNGLINHESVYRLLNSEDVNRNRRTAAAVRYEYAEMLFVLNILRKFRLSFLAEDGVELLPMLCCANAAPVAEAYENDPEVLEFRLEYEYLPSNVVHRLIVDRRKELDRQNIWRTGARFVNEWMGLSAVVMCDGNILRILVRQDQLVQKPQIYLNALRTDLVRISEEMGLSVARMQVAYKQGVMVQYFDYEGLLERLQNGDEYNLSSVFRRNIPTREILKQTDHMIVQEQNKLLSDMTKVCAFFQNTKILQQAAENDRNDALRSQLRSMGYAAANPPMLGMGAGGKIQREVDILLMNEDRQPWTVIEALNVQKSSRSAFANWDAHLSKLLTRYNTQGLQMLLLISYVNCPEDKYQKLYFDYREHMRWYDPEHSGRLTGTFKHTTLPEGAPSFLNIDQCSYDCGGVTATVYHYFLWMGEGEAEKAGRAQPAIPVQRPVELYDVPTEERPSGSENAAVTDTAAEPPSTEYRVVILGDSEAGKSLICARLKDPHIDPRAYPGEVTPGINILRKDHRIGDLMVRVNYWDFGGQEILHSMHRMFLADQTLYVIVLNTRNDKQDAQADFWMRYVQTYAPGAPVVLVLNKIDQNPSAALNLPALKRQFPTLFNVLDVLSISARDWSEQEFREGFADKLLDYIRQVIDPVSSFTHQETRIRDRLRRKRRTHRIIDVDSFRDWCEEEGVVDSDKQIELMRRFNQAGILVFFGENYKMLLDPEWITKAIYKILEKRRYSQTNGIIDEQDISGFYRQDPDKVYRSKHAQSVLAVMRAYGLSFQCEKQIPGNPETKDREFIPMLCRKEEPKQVAEILMLDELVEMQVRFEYLPIGVLHQLMVEYHEILDRELVWLTGAVFHHQSGVNILARKDGNVLHLYAWSQAMDISAGHLRHLAERVREIASDVRHRAAVLETLIGFNVAGITEFFDYDRLLIAKTSDIRYTASKIRHAPISVQDILDQTDRSEEREARELLRLTLAGCRELQMNQTYWFWDKDCGSDHVAPKMDENARNRLLRLKLEQSFFVKDQPQGGESSTGISPGELDLWIGTDRDKPLAILEALNITGDNADSRKRWKEHLNRMVKNYNKSGQRYLVLVSYLDCPAEQIAHVHRVYSEMLEHARFDIYGGAPADYDHDPMPEHLERMRVTRADYAGGAGKVSVYHVLVHIPRYLGE